MSDTIARESARQQTDASVVSAILRHESAAVERRALTPLPWLGPGAFSDPAEASQTVLQGDTASIGPGQMQLRRARELEQLGYVGARKNDVERVSALLSSATAVEYVTGMVRYLSDQLHSVAGYASLSPEEQNRILLIGYNQGWDLLKENIEILGFTELIQRSQYDNQTLEEYIRWIQGR